MKTNQPTIKSLQRQVKALEKAMQHYVSENIALQAKYDEAKSNNFGVVQKALKELGMNSQEYFFTIEKMRSFGVQLKNFESELNLLRAKYNKIVQ